MTHLIKSTWLWTFFEDLEKIFYKDSHSKDPKVQYKLKEIEEQALKWQASNENRQ